MASIRERLSRVWRRSLDEDSSSIDNQSTVTNRSSFSSLDSGYSSIPTRKSNTSLEVSGSVKAATPRTLHKVASTTFQTFSDTIRSKARVFYVSPKKVDVQSIDWVKDEEDTPRNHRPRSSRWSASARSRKSHASQDDQRELGRTTPTPIAPVARSQEMTPTINVKIPSSFLIDSGRSEDETNLDSPDVPYQAAALKPCEARQLWPSPISEALQQLSKIDLFVTDVPRSPMIQEPHSSSSDDFMYDSAMFDPVPPAPPASPEDQRGMDEGHLYSEEDQSEVKLVGTIREPGSATHLMPNRCLAMKRQLFSNSLFFKGGQARIYFKGTHDTPPVLRQDQKEVLEATIDLEASSTTTELSDCLDMPEPSSVHAKGIQRPTFYRTLSHTTGLNDLADPSNTFLGNKVQESGGYRIASSLNEAGTGSASPSPELPAMGSRREWAEARADRDNRYFAIRSLDDDEKTEEDSEYGVELQRSPKRKLLQETTGAILALPDVENREQITDLNSPNPGMTDSNKKTPDSPSKPILYALEATVKNLSDLNLDLPEQPGSGLEKNDDKYAFQPPMTGHSATVEAALHRLIEGKQEWSNISSYDSEEDEPVHEEPCGATNLPIISTLWLDGQEHKDIAGNEGGDFGLNRRDIIHDSYKNRGGEKYQFEIAYLETGDFWSRVCKMDESRSTEFPGARPAPRRFGFNGSMISESEYGSIDDKSVYLNPCPFPDLELLGPVSPFSKVSETSLTDQGKPLAPLTQKDNYTNSEALILPENTFSGFWSDLGQDLREYIEGRQAAERNFHKQGGIDSKESLPCFDEMLKEAAEIKIARYENIIRHEVDDQDRAFNAARLPKFNSIPSKAPYSLPHVPESRIADIQLEPYYYRQDFDAASNILINDEHHARYKAADKKSDPTGKLPNGCDQTSPGKKGVWWANDVEDIDKSNSFLVANDAGNRWGAPEAQASTRNEVRKAATFANHLRELNEMENELEVVMGHAAWF